MMEKFKLKIGEKVFSTAINLTLLIGVSAGIVAAFTPLYV